MNTDSLTLRLKWLLIFSILMVIDIGPIPVTALLALSVVLVRPKWFKEGVDRIYGESRADRTPTGSHSDKH